MPKPRPPHIGETTAEESDSDAAKALERADQPRPAARPAFQSAPKPEPLENPSAAQARPNLPTMTYAPQPELHPSAPAAPALPTPPVKALSGDACAQLLASGQVVGAKIPPISGPGACGVKAPVRLSAIVMTDGRKIPLAPEPVLCCTVAAEVADWLVEDVVSLAEKNGRKVARIYNAAAYDCRGRNRVVGAQLSQHAFGNAIDMRALEFVGGKKIEFGGRHGEDRALASGLRETACARFTTVLGPGSDGYHEDHVHVDLMDRRRGRTYCKWVLR